MFVNYNQFYSSVDAAFKSLKGTKAIKSRPLLQMIHLVAKDNLLRIEATNSYTAFTTHLQVNCEGEELDLLISPEMFKTLPKPIKKNESDAKITLENETIIFEVYNSIFNFKNSGMTYPNLEKLYPDNITLDIQLDSKLLKALCEAANGESIILKIHQDNTQQIRPLLIETKDSNAKMIILPQRINK